MIKAYRRLAGAVLATALVTGFASAANAAGPGVGNPPGGVAPGDLASAAESGSGSAPTGFAVRNAGFEADDAAVNYNIPGWQVEGTHHAAFTTGPGRTGGFALTHSGDRGYRAFTSQRITALPDGYYTLNAYAQSGGGDQSVYLSAVTTGAAEVRTAVPVASTWTLITVRGVKVTNRTLTIGLRSDAPNGGWARLDDVSLTGGAPYDFAAGGDVTMVNWVENSGGKYLDRNGVQKDPFQILAENGNDIVRLRVYTATGPDHPSLADPAYYLPAGYQDEADMLSLARRAAAHGMRIQLTLHYSDWWSNGAIQDIPKDWRYVTALPADQAAAELERLVYDYTSKLMRRMAAQGTLPASVSLGNEMQGGLLFPYGSSWANGETGVANLARFLKAGYRAVKEVSPATQVIIHIDDAGNYNKYQWFFGLLNSHGVPFDVIGSSYYPYWTRRDIPTVTKFFTDISAAFGKKIMVMETGINWNPVTHEGVQGQLHSNGPVPYGETPAGQRDFLLDLFAALKSVPDGAVIGDLYWDPVMIPAPGVGWAVGGPNVVSNTTLFDFGGRALPGLDAYRYNTDASAVGAVTGRVTDRRGAPIVGATVTLTLRGSVRRFVTDTFGDFYAPDLPPGSYAVATKSAGGRSVRVIAGGLTSGVDLRV